MARKPKTVRIRLKEGRMPTTAIQFAPGGGPRPRVLTPETSHEVVWNSFIRRRLRRGDFVETQAEEAALEEKKAARAPLKRQPRPADAGEKKE